MNAQYPERKLTWRDGFAIALLVPVSIFATLADSITIVGSAAVLTLFAIACTVGLLQNFLYAELAGMYPDKAGGVALYANEAWRRYFKPTGAVAAFGYWAGWSFGVAVMALAFGSLLHAQFFSGITWTVDLGAVDAGFGHLLGILALLLVSWLNRRGIQLTALLAKILGFVSVSLILLFIIGPFVVGEFQLDGLTWNLAGGIEGWHTAIVFLFLFAWAAYGTEVCATFTPEYRDPQRDTPRSLRIAGLVTLAGATLTPLAIGGTVGDTSIAADPGGIYVNAFAAIVGPASWLVTLVMAAAFLLVMNGATADSGRALYGIAREDLTVRQIDHLNRNGEPGRAIGIALVTNIALVLFVGNPLGIIFAANVGYVLAHFCAITAFLLLRKDRPGAPRMIRLHSAWIPIAVVLALYNLVILVVGALSPGIAGYGGLTQQLIGIGVLALSLVLLAYRRLIQDRQPPAPEPDIEPEPTTPTATTTSS